MKTISANLQAAINSGKICNIYTIIAKDGTTKRFTDTNQSLTYDGNTYVPTAAINKFKLRLTNTGEIDNQQVAATILDLPADELKSGKWDNANVESAIISWENTSWGKLITFKGNIGVIQWTDEGFRADIQNYMRNLNKNIGDVVTANCRHQLFSTTGKIGFCGVNKASFTDTSSVTNIISQKLKFVIVPSGQVHNWATNGQIKFTSGANAGLTYHIKKHNVFQEDINSETIELFLPTLAPIALGTTFEFYAGCDHTYDTCKSKFSNGINFGGFPHLQTDVNLSMPNG